MFGLNSLDLVSSRTQLAISLRSLFHESENLRNAVKSHVGSVRGGGGEGEA